MTADSISQQNKEIGAANKMQAKDLTVGWQQKPIAYLDELSIESGQILALAGPNGVGKSTIIKTLARQIPPLTGNITIDQKSSQSLSSKDFARAVAYIPQFIQPIHDITVAELVAMGRYPHQMWWSWETSNSDRQAIDNALERTSCFSLRDRLVSNLSGGERQRVSVAMALAQESKFMLLDEPTAHLDFKHQLQLLTLLNELRKDGLGIIIILHDLNLIAQLADSIILLQPNDGPSKVAGIGTPDELLTPKLLKEVYEVRVSITLDPETKSKNYVPIGESLKQ